jgi:formate hydrogenlyase subunit 3/multisubunit Na+/H+ antiporter MnhD subunit
MVNILLISLALSITAILFFDARIKGIITVITVIAIAALTGVLAIGSLTGKAYELIMAGPSLFGNVPVRLDALSAWFILVINFTMLTGTFYGFNYLRKYQDRRNALTLHYISLLLVHISLIGVCVVQNSFVFLLLWEILALSVFILVIFDNRNPDTVKAGINYLVQSHISIVILMLGFVYYAINSGSYDFEAIKTFSSEQSSLAGTALFILFFAGFALKAGFVPFHTWLPYAHPAAPSHVSGIMSGVVIKIGIFGILRMLLLIKADFMIVGYFILAISLISGIYGVMLAIIQHDLKRLLAYHSIENIGIIGIGIGVGCIGLGSVNKWMAILGFSGALLHTLNHSLFKSLLFYSAGNVLQSTHTASIERLGGLIKKMPQTSILFLIGAVAICGLPPLNGFISEFVIYGGLYNWLYSAGLISQIAIIFAVTGLVLIGGLAIMCFTKAFGMQNPVFQFTNDIIFNMTLIRVGAIDSLQTINWLFLAFIVLVLLIAGLRKLVTRNKIIESGPTWGCGYNASGSKMQYTANSFVRSYSKLAKPALDIEKHEVEISEIFPAEKHYETHPYDKVEKNLIDIPLRLIDRILDRFLFLQNGQLQRYILYGIIFMASIICIPLLFDKIASIVQLLKDL